MHKLSSCIKQKLGRRHAVNEDSFIIQTCLTETTPHLSLFGVFDGHADEKASAYVAEHLVRVLVESEAFQNGHFDEAMRECIAQLHSHMIDAAVSKGGTTVSLALVDQRQEGQTTLAFLGDSPIFVRRKSVRDDVYLAFPMHHSSNPAIATRICSRGVATAPWDLKRHPRGINLYGSIGDALYEPEVANPILRVATKLRAHAYAARTGSEDGDENKDAVREGEGEGEGRASEEMGAASGGEDDVSILFKRFLEQELAEGPVLRNVRVQSPETLSYYLADSVKVLPFSPLQRVPDIMSIPTAELDMILIGSDGAFPLHYLHKAMDEMYKVTWFPGTEDNEVLSDLVSKLINGCVSSDDKTVVAIKIAEG